MVGTKIKLSKYGTVRGYALTVAVLSCLATTTTFSMTYFGSDGAFPRGLCTMIGNSCVPDLWRFVALNAAFAAALFGMFMVPYALVATVFGFVERKRG